MFKKTLIAAALGGSLMLSAGPSAALTSSEVLSAMNDRIAELAVEIADLQSSLAGASGAEQQAILMEIRVLGTRSMQLRSISRIIPRLPEARLAQYVNYFQLEVSPGSGV